LHLSVLLVLGCAAPALAQSQPELQSQPEIIIDAKQPPTVEREMTTGVVKPPPGPGRDAFDAQSIAVDPMQNTVSSGRKPLPARDFYQRVGRPDLVRWSEDRTRQRIWLISGGGLILAAGVLSGAYVMGTGPNTSSPECQNGDFNTYSGCISQAEKAQMTGAVLIGAGLALGGVLIIWGMSTPEMVTSPEETQKMATEYNRGLAEKNGASTSSQLRFQLLPAVAAGYAGLTAKLWF